MLSCKGPSKTTPGKNSQRLAKIISCVVLAGELSLLASQCTNDLVQTHMRLNRYFFKINTYLLCFPTVPFRFVKLLN